jgi:hypothetical protein
LQAETIEKKLLWLDYRDARDEHAQCKDLSKEQQVRAAAGVSLVPSLRSSQLLCAGAEQVDIVSSGGNEVETSGQEGPGCHVALPSQEIVNQLQEEQKQDSAPIRYVRDRGCNTHVHASSPYDTSPYATHIFACSLSLHVCSACTSAYMRSLT